MNEVEFDLPSNFRAGMIAEIIFYVPLESKHSSYALIKDGSNYMIYGAFEWDRKRVVLNTKSGGHWGTEVDLRDSIDFKQGDEIVIRYKAEADHFVVFVNGKELSKFNYRFPLSDAKAAKAWPNLEFKNWTVHF